MLAAVTLVGMLVQIYSVGYMKGEPRYGWYYAVLSLFIASMMTLVLADNFLLLYITWEGVGICSYLLIGHYYERRSAAEAAKKAFITTRIGDVFLLIGIILLWREAGTFDMPEIFHMAEEGGFDKTYLTWRPCSSLAAPWARAPSSPSTSGCRTPWRARRRSPR